MIGSKQTWIQGFWHPFRPTWPGPVGSFLQPFQTDSVDGPRNRRARAVQKEIRFQGPGFESGLGPDTCWLTIFGGAIFEVRLPPKNGLGVPFPFCFQRAFTSTREMGWGKSCKGFLRYCKPGFAGLPRPPAVLPSFRGGKLI